MLVRLSVLGCALLSSGALASGDLESCMAGCAAKVSECVNSCRNGEKNCMGKCQNRIEACSKTCDGKAVNSKPVKESSKNDHAPNAAQGAPGVKR